MVKNIESKLKSAGVIAAAVLVGVTFSETLYPYLIKGDWKDVTDMTQKITSVAATVLYFSGYMIEEYKNKISFNKSR